jgi:hypothetical protein
LYAQQPQTNRRPSVRPPNAGFPDAGRADAPPTRPYVVGVLWATAALLGILAVLFVGMLGFEMLGQRIGARRIARGDVPSGQGNAAIEGSLFALLGLLVAFTISGGESRLNVRRDLTTREANAIGTAYLRLDLLPEEAQPILREEFRRYVDTRIDYFAHILDLKQARADDRRVHTLQDQIWKDAVAAAADAPDSRATLLVLPAINEMIDITTAHEAAILTHVPIALLALLILLSFGCSFFAGLGMAKQRRPSRVHMIAFAVTLAVTAYVILNLEFPRAGFVRMRMIDELLAQVRAGMG